MQGKSSTNFPFDVEINGTLRAQLRKARLQKLEEQEEINSHHSDTESEK